MSETMNIEQLLEIIDHSEAAVLHEYVTDINAVDVDVHSNSMTVSYGSCVICCSRKTWQEFWNRQRKNSQSEWFSPLQMMN